MDTMAACDDLDSSIRDSAGLQESPRPSPEGAGLDKETTFGPYTYAPLSVDKSEIRLVEILPGKLNEDIIVELHREAFNEQGAFPDYEALSYVWRDAQDQRQIFITDCRRLYTLLVTRNCEEALRRFRLTDRPRTFWIDAICINQKDLGERSRQVKLMASIYTRAARVQVWLGHAAESSKLAMAWIDYVGSRVGDRDLVEEPMLGAKEAELDALANLVSRAWWERLWVWQEVRAGQDWATLVCGDDEITWQKVLDTAALFNTKIPETAPGLYAFARTRFIVLLFALPVHLDVMETVRACQCTNPRDRVYAADLWKSEGMVISPDYTLAVEDVYTDFVLKEIRSSACLRLLDFAGEVPRSGNVQTPFWVPNWSVPWTYVTLDAMNASANSKAVLGISDVS